jgi:hypothetical protein
MLPIRILFLGVRLLFWGRRGDDWWGMAQREAVSFLQDLSIGGILFANQLQLVFVCVPLLWEFDFS